jgi:hypothetical protein
MPSLQWQEYSLKGFEEDILDVNIKYGQLWKIKWDKEKRA